MTTRTACRRRQRRQLLIHDPQARVAFEQNGLRHSLALVDLSPSGLSFTAEAEQMPQFESGTTVRAVEVQVADCRIRGELVVMHVTQATGGNPVCGALIYPETDGDLTKLKALVAGLEAARPS